MKNAKILIVDDNEKDLKLLNDYLSSHEYSVVTAKDGEEAFSQMQIQKPDLVILDINMPDLSGWKTCDKIKNDPLCCDVPILMCSSYIQEGDDFSQYQAGDAYIQKPVNLVNLLTTIQKLLDKKSADQG
jgi:CheY-like chemotaxis protein